MLPALLDCSLHPHRLSTQSALLTKAVCYSAVAEDKGMILRTDLLGLWQQTAEDRMDQLLPMQMPLTMDLH